MVINTTLCQERGVEVGGPLLYSLIGFIKKTIATEDIDLSLRWVNLTWTYKELLAPADLLIQGWYLFSICVYDMSLCGEIKLCYRAY